MKGRKYVMTPPDGSSNRMIGTSRLVDKATGQEIDSTLDIHQTPDTVVVSIGTIERKGSRRTRTYADKAIQRFVTLSRLDMIHAARAEARRHVTFSSPKPEPGTKRSRSGTWMTCPTCNGCGEEVLAHRYITCRQCKGRFRIIL